MKFFRNGDSGKLECLVCGHHCQLGPGQRGICGVRQNTGSEIVCLTAGRITCIHPDPMEKKPLFHFLPGEKVLSVGSWGCNMNCPWCQNWEISQNYPMDSAAHVTEPWELIEITEREKVPALGFTYNEPTVALEYMIETLILAKKRSIKTILVTNGYFSSEATQALIPLLDGVNIDLKFFQTGKYQKYTRGKLELVKQNISQLWDAGVWVELTSLIIPKFNDDKVEWKNAAQWLKSISPSIPWHFTGFHPSYKMSDGYPTPPALLGELRTLAMKEGLDYVYSGNTVPGFTHTICPDCKKELIHRDGYKIISHGFSGICGGCGKNIPGVWKI